MIETFKLTGIYDKRVTEDLLPVNKSTFHQTRGHSLRLAKNRSRLDIRKYYFTNRLERSTKISYHGQKHKNKLKTDSTSCGKTTLWCTTILITIQTTTGRRQLNQIDNEVEPNIEEQADLLRLEQTWID